MAAQPNEDEGGALAAAAVRHLGPGWFGGLSARGAAALWGLSPPALEWAILRLVEAACRPRRSAVEEGVRRLRLATACMGAGRAAAVERAVRTVLGGPRCPPARAPHGSEGASWQSVPLGGRDCGCSHCWRRSGAGRGPWCRPCSPFAQQRRRWLRPCSTRPPARRRRSRSSLRRWRRRSKGHATWRTTCGGHRRRSRRRCVLTPPPAAGAPGPWFAPVRRRLRTSLTRPVASIGQHFGWVLLLLERAVVPRCSSDRRDEVGDAALECTDFFFGAPAPAELTAAAAAAVDAPGDPAQLAMLASLRSPPVADIRLCATLVVVGAGSGSARAADPEAGWLAAATALRKRTAGEAATVRARHAPNIGRFGLRPRRRRPRRWTCSSCGAAQKGARRWADGACRGPQRE